MFILFFFLFILTCDKNCYQNESSRIIEKSGFWLEIHSSWYFILDIFRFFQYLVSPLKVGEHHFYTAYEIYWQVIAIIVIYINYVTSTYMCTYIWVYSLSICLMARGNSKIYTVYRKWFYTVHEIWDIFMY